MGGGEKVRGKKRTRKGSEGQAKNGLSKRPESTEAVSYRVKVIGGGHAGRPA